VAIVGGDFNAVSCRQMRVSQRALDAADHALRLFELDSARCSHVGCALRPARAGEDGHASADEGAGVGPLKRVMHDNDVLLRGTSSSATLGIVPPLGIQSVVWGGNTKYPKVVFIDLWGIGDCSPPSVFSLLCGV